MSQIDSTCEARSSGIRRSRCSEPPPLTGGNINPHCEHCSKNLCHEHLSKHRCHAMRAAKGETPRTTTHKKAKPADPSDVWWKRAMRLRATLEAVHATLRGRSSLPLQARVDQCVEAIMRSLADAS